MSERLLSYEIVIDRLRSAINLAGGTRALAREWGCNATLISHVMHGREQPGPKILVPLGIRKEIIYLEEATP